MQIKNTTFIQRHAEKLAIGSAGLFFLLVALYYLLGVPSQPFGISLGNAKQGKMNISDVPDVMKAKAEELNKYLQAGKPPRNVSPVDPADHRPPNYQDDFRRLCVMPVASGQPLLLAGALPIAAGDVNAQKPDIIPYFLPHPSVPTSPKAMAGRVVLAGGEDRSYVSVEGLFNAAAWAELLATGTKVGKDAKDAVKELTGVAPLNPAMIKRGQAIAGVYLEREEWDARKRKWTDLRRILMEDQACYPSDRSGPDADQEPEKAAALIRSIMDNQAAIQRPAYPALDAASPLPLLREAPKLEATDTAPTVLLGSGESADKQEKFPPMRLWSHDFTVEPGVKYRYRLVACVLNPIYGITRANLSPDQAKDNATRVSLSPESAVFEKTAKWVECQVPATAHCFLVESANIKKATFEVWRVIGGGWVKKAFEVKVGDSIGSRQEEVTQADGSIRPMNLDAQRVLVDILDLADPATGIKTRAVLLMGVGGRMETHYLSQDLESAERKTLLGDVGAGKAK